MPFKKYNAEKNIFDDNNALDNSNFDLSPINGNFSHFNPYDSNNLFDVDDYSDEYDVGFDLDWNDYELGFNPYDGYGLFDDEYDGSDMYDYWDDFDYDDLDDYTYYAPPIDARDFVRFEDVSDFVSDVDHQLSKVWRELNILNRSNRHLLDFEIDNFQRNQMQNNYQNQLPNNPQYNDQNYYNNYDNRGQYDDRNYHQDNHPQQFNNQNYNDNNYPPPYLQNQNDYYQDDFDNQVHYDDQKYDDELDFSYQPINFQQQYQKPNQDFHQQQLAQQPRVEQYNDQQQPYVEQYSVPQEPFVEQYNNQQQYDQNYQDQYNNVNQQQYDQNSLDNQHYQEEYQNQYNDVDQQQYDQNYQENYEQDNQQYNQDYQDQYEQNNQQYDQNYQEEYNNDQYVQEEYADPVVQAFDDYSNRKVQEILPPDSRKKPKTKKVKKPKKAPPKIKAEPKVPLDKKQDYIIRRTPNDFYNYNANVNFSLPWFIYDYTSSEIQSFENILNYSNSLQKNKKKLTALVVDPYLNPIGVGHASGSGNYLLKNFAPVNSKKLKPFTKCVLYVQEMPKKSAIDFLFENRMNSIIVALKLTNYQKLLKSGKIDSFFEKSLIKGIGFYIVFTN